MTRQELEEKIDRIDAGNVRIPLNWLGGYNELERMKQQFIRLMRSLVGLLFFWFLLVLILGVIVSMATKFLC